MPKDKRYLVREGSMETDANVILVENNGVRLIGASLSSAVPVHVLAGDNYATAKEADWAPLYDPHGNAVELSETRPYIQLVHGGIYRLDPAAATASGGSVFMEDDEYLAPERVMFTYDQYAGNVAQAAQAAAANETAETNTQALVDAINALQLALAPTPPTELTFISSEELTPFPGSLPNLTVPADATEADIQNIGSLSIVYRYAGSSTTNYLLPGQHMRIVGQPLLTALEFYAPTETMVDGGGAGTQEETRVSTITVNYFQAV